MGGDLNDTISEKKGKPLRIDEERVSWASDDVSLLCLFLMLGCLTFPRSFSKREIEGNWY